MECDLNVMNNWPTFNFGDLVIFFILSIISVLYSLSIRASGIPNFNLVSLIKKIITKAMCMYLTSKMFALVILYIYHSIIITHRSFAHGCFNYQKFNSV